MLITQTPFAQYSDVDGLPLSGGSLYFGQVGQNPRTAPVAIFWDTAGTQPAAQPVKTLGGYPVRNGSPSNVYTSGAYSVALYNAAGELVFYAPDSAAFDAVLSTTTTYSRSLLSAANDAAARATLSAVGLTGDETIAGIKTFSSSPVLPGNASSALQAVPKQQLDAVAAARMQYSLTASQATTSGTAVAFTGIPSWARRISLMYRGVRVSGTSYVSIQLGTSSGFQTSGCDGAFVAPVQGATSVGAQTSSGFTLTANQSSAEFRHGICTFVHVGGNMWVMSNVGAASAGTVATATLAGGSIQLAGTLDRLQVYTLNTTDTFTNGSVILLIEG